MPLAIRNLQLIYGVAGAREAFETMCSLLIKNEYADAQAIRVFKGDGGVDETVGNWDDNAPVIVFQQKYFIDQIGRSQRGQIMESYQTASQNPRFTLGPWILCLPINLSPDEKTWFDNWKGRQEHDIELWDEGKLQALLLEEKNRGIKEHYFKEDYLHQVREIHTTIIEIAANLRQNINTRRGKDHDVKLLEHIAVNLLGPRFLEMLHFMPIRLSIEPYQREMLATYEIWSKDPYNGFLLPAMGDLAATLNTELEELLGFIAQHFYSSDVVGDYTIFLEPGARHDPMRNQYFIEKTRAFDTHVGRVTETYTNFIRQGKQILREHGLI